MVLYVPTDESLFDDASEPGPSVFCTSPIVAEQVFQDQQLLVDDDVAHSQSERRFHALGVTASGRRLHVTFTLRAEGTLIRVISARDMHRKERAFHGKKT